MHLDVQLLSTRVRAPRWRRVERCAILGPVSAAPASELLSKLFGAPWAQECLGDRARLQGMLDFEAALARAEARAGVIPTGAADGIARKCRADLFDTARLADGAARGRNPPIGIARALAP